MNYLLDTHTLIWFLEDNTQLSAKALKTIRNIDNSILFSQISLFEIAIKQKIGNLPFFDATIIDIYKQSIEENLTFCPIQNTHLQAYQSVSLYPEHRDPFDRLLIATAVEEKLSIITVDKNFDLYADFIEIMW